MKAIFITGTDTDVGKTLITGLLGWWMQEQGLSVITQKWVETGLGGDIDMHLRIMKKRREDFGKYADLMLPYSFKFPSSPHLAAELEQREIDPEKIRQDFKRISSGFEYVLVEGAGGLLVPLSRRLLLGDLVWELGLSVLIVAGNRLGAINHTLLTIEALRRRGMKIVGVVFNNLFKDQEELIIKDNPKIVEELSPGMVLGSLIYGEIQDLYKEFKPIGERIFKRWMNG